MHRSHWRQIITLCVLHTITSQPSHGGAGYYWQQLHTKFWVLDLGIVVLKPLITMKIKSSVDLPK